MDYGNSDYSPMICHINTNSRIVNSNKNIERKFRKTNRLHYYNKLNIILTSDEYSRGYEQFRSILNSVADETVQDIPTP